MKSLTLITLLPALTLAFGARAELPQKRVLDLETASRVAAAAERAAKERNATVVITVVDDGGYPIVLKRLDDTQVASVDVGIAKARTAAIFRRPSKVFEDQVKNGRVAALALPGAVALQGGLPLIVDGRVIGAVGVSGNTPQEDEEIAGAGVAALVGSEGAPEKPKAQVTRFPAQRVRKAFEKGEPLLESESYKIHASHRDAPGVAEIHERDTDIIYVLKGTATFVTGGIAVEPKPTAKEEIRGTTIEGGDTHQLAAGDVIVVPNGVPHWFTKVSKPFDYYVVKVRSEEESGP
ncbi:MAG: heme-binding protein [Gammaproteobacteria bacterium]